MPGHQQTGLQRVRAQFGGGPEEEVDPGVLEIVDVPAVVHVAQRVHIAPPKRTVVNVPVVMSHTAIIASWVLRA
ncbi:hypothetical protein GCM10009745_20950 [Kribbella yunnanensis]|uniref:Uncharacterized protein n=1 Tax=Kribbella yunnanensis TaxID=190194 RepID=A0ABN2GVC9_9ACTN